MTILEPLFPNAPVRVRNLGMLGLLPFVLGALMCLFGGEQTDAMGVRWLLIWGMITMLFLAGMHLGQSTVGGESDVRMGMSAIALGCIVMVSAAGFDGKWALLPLLIGFSGHCAIRFDALPSWFERMKRFLETGVVICLLIGLLFG
ncbi:MAG: hypothetical protein CSB44_00025 [Gammaproteobacteria bacterium]|nr:MAG: hypothetical protein CSB44_00025 [Gammaproteobacteria bacterium]